MRKYLVKRLLLSVVILFFVTFIIYLLMRCMPSSYVENMARQLSQAPGSKPYEEWLAQLNAQYGLDLGLIPGFFVQLKNLCTGNFGDSWKYTVPVIQKFNEVIWVSFIMGAISLVFELLIAVPLGIVAATKQYSVIYADPPWAYQQAGATAKARGTAVKHYPTMTTAEICALPVREIVRGGAACFMWATFPNITEAIKVMEAWGFTYKTAAFVWVKKNRKNGGNFMGMGAYTRANAEVCLLGVTPGFKAKTQIRAHNVRQIIEAPFEGHSKKPDETRQRIVELLGDVPRLEMFARQRADGWDAWGNEAPEA